MQNDNTKRYLVTGADGFIGSHLTELILSKRQKVRALSMYNSFNSWGWLEGIPSHDNLEIVTGDIRDPDFCREITKNVDIVFHLAALIGIPYSYKAPDNYVDTNIKGTLHLCQASKSNNVKKFIHTSTSEVYGTAQYVPIDEKHPKQPQSPYSASKIGADALAMSFYYAFNFPVTIVRPFNTYGPRQSARAIIPSIIIQILNGAKKIKLGDMRPTRDFNYVKDIVQGFWAISKINEAFGQEINIASNSEISIEECANLISELMQSQILIIRDEERIRPEKSEVFRLWGDNKKIKKLTGWKPEYTFKEGLRETIKWFIEVDNLKKYKSGIYNF